MSGAPIEVGEKIHVITRRLFPDDVRRHFAGQVTFSSGDLVRAEGFIFVLNSETNMFRRRPERRTRIFSLSDAGNNVNVLPPDVEIDSLEYKSVDNRLLITDGRSFKLDVNEFGISS